MKMTSAELFGIRGWIVALALFFMSPVWGEAGDVKGVDAAPITIIEYADFQCPSCRQAGSVLDEVIKGYPGEVGILFKHYPSATNPQSVLAHKAALAASEQGKFWEMHDRLFAHTGAITEEVLKRYAQELGLDLPQFLRTLHEPRLQEMLDRDIREAKGFGVTHTPTFFINGKKLVGARSASDFKRVIDETLGLAHPVDTPPSPPAPVPTKPAPVKVDTAGAYALGPESAPVVIVEFSDFQCPFCAKVIPTLKEVVKKYPKEVRLVFKHFPLAFHKDAPLAHEASMAAGEQGKFWEMHDLIFENRAAMKRENLLAHAEKLNLDIKKFTAALDSGKYKAVVEKDIAEGSRLGVTGTPTFFVNGERLVGAKPLQVFSDKIDAALAAKK